MEEELSHEEQMKFMKEKYKNYKEKKPTKKELEEEVKILLEKLIKLEAENYMLRNDLKELSDYVYKK